MTRAGRLGAALLLAGTAVGLWAYGLVVWQPVAEARLTCADCGTDVDWYWAREVRWAAILAVLGLVVVLAGGARRRSGYALLGALAWVTADIALDRAEPARSALLPMAWIAGAVVTLAVIVADRGSGTPRRRVLVAAAAVCACTAPAVAWLEAPAGTGSAVVVAARLACALLVAVALAAALTAARIRAPRDLRPKVLAVVVGVVTFALLVGVAGGYGRFAGAAGLLTGVWLLSRPGRPRRQFVLGVPAVAIGGPALLVLAALLTLDSGRPFTAWAGNTYLTVGDFDTLALAGGIGAGLALAAFRFLAEWLPAELRRAAPAVPAPSV